MRSLARLVFVSCLAACGGSGYADDEPYVPPEPMLIPGGGVAGGQIASVLHVHVVELDSATPIAGASVTVAGRTATTNAQGLISFADFTGPQTVTAVAPGRAAATWIGVAGANVTLPLQPQRVPQAAVSGTLAGGLQAPTQLGHYTLAVVLYSFLEDPTAPENSIPQPMNGTTPLFTCINTNVLGSPIACNWQINARVGKQIHTAVLVDGDARGTTSPDDDTYTLIGYAAGDTMTLTDGQTVTGETLQMVAGTQGITVSFPAAPAGLPNAIAIPELQLADGAGRVVFPLPPLSAGSPSKAVLAPAGKFAGTYELVGLATPSTSTSTPFSTSFVHSVGASAALPPWLAAPVVRSAARAFAFDPAPGAAFHTVQFTRNRTPLWNVTVLDASTSFTLPSVSPDPIGTGATTGAVTAADVPGFDRAQFQISAVKAALVRASGAEANALF